MSRLPSYFGTLLLAGCCLSGAPLGSTAAWAQTATTITIAPDTPFALFAGRNPAAEITEAMWAEAAALRFAYEKSLLPAEAYFDALPGRHFDRAILEAHDEPGPQHVDHYREGVLSPDFVEPTRIRCAGGVTLNVVVVSVSFGAYCGYDIHIPDGSDIYSVFDRVTLDGVDTFAVSSYSDTMVNLLTFPVTPTSLNIYPVFPISEFDGDQHLLPAEYEFEIDDVLSNLAFRDGKAFFSINATMTGIHLGDRFIPVDRFSDAE